MAHKPEQILWLHQKQQRRQQPESGGLSLSAGTAGGLWSSFPVLQVTELHSDPDVIDCRELHLDFLL